MSPFVDVADGVLAFRAGDTDGGAPGSLAGRDGAVARRWCGVSCAGRQREIRARCSQGPSYLSPRVTNNLAGSVMPPHVGFVTPGTRWYNAAGRTVPTSERALNAAVARVERRFAPQARRLRRQQLAAALGAHPSGIEILHPSIASLPPDLLSLSTGRGQPPVDLHEVREVRTASGADAFVIPEADGACIYSFSTQRGVGAGMSISGGSGTCTGSIGRALANGLVEGGEAGSGQAITVWRSSTSRSRQTRPGGSSHRSRRRGSEHTRAPRDAGSGTATCD